MNESIRRNFLFRLRDVFRLLVCFSLSIFAACQKAEEKPRFFRQVATVAADAGVIAEPFGVAVRGETIFVADGEGGAIWQVDRAGALSRYAAGLDTPSQIVFDAAGDLIVADAGSHTIKKVKPDGAVEIVAGVAGRAGDGDGEAASALFRAPVGVAVDGERIYVADTYNDRIRVIENGRVATLAGGAQGFADGPGAEARFDTPAGLAALGGGRLVVADSSNGRLRVVEASGEVWTLAGRGAAEPLDGPLGEAALFRPLGVSADDAGRIFFTDGNAVRVVENFAFPFVRTLSATRRGFRDGALAVAAFNRPANLAADANGNLFVADAENQALRVIAVDAVGRTLSEEEIENRQTTAEAFRAMGEARWCYDPPQAVREIAGTLGEIRGEMTAENDQVWFHNGLDVVGAYGETARFVRPEKVLRLDAAENFDTLRELLRMPTLGYIHIRLGRDQRDQPFDDARFLFARDGAGKITGVRVPRGARFAAGEAIGTLNALNHVHLIAGRSGSEMNAIDALSLPGAADRIAPTIEEIAVFDENWRALETLGAAGRINLNGKIRVVARAYDRMDGNAERRRLGPYEFGYQIFKDDLTPVTSEPVWTIRFDRLPAPEAVRLVYAPGSKSGATGETVFKYIVTNRVRGDRVAAEDFFDAAPLANGNYFLRVYARDYFGNTAQKDLPFEVNK